ncbi:MAG: hypothetical protein ACXVCY_15415 [Pseudobdellovibrionaceae bacterium]
MKNFFFFFVTIIVSNSVFASGNKVHCASDALKAASYIDELGWGKVKSEPLKVTAGTRDESGAEEIQVKSTVSGYSYKISILQDPRSEACVITEIKTAP